MACNRVSLSFAERPPYLMLAKALLTCLVLCVLGPLSLTLGSGE